MARRLQISTKRILISKANSTIVVAVGVAAFVTAFALVASRSLLAKRSYQARVIAAREDARDQLQENIAAVDSLKASYQAFVSRPENIIAGSSTGTGERDGDNAKIVLDALPSKYDFPALAASLEKILTDRNYKIQSIGGTDDELNQNSGGVASDASSASSSSSSSSTTPGSSPSQPVGTAVDMPFELGAEGAYTAMIDLLSVSQKSIRPLFVERLTLSADQAGVVRLTVQGKSYYQPEKTLTITEEVVQ